MNIDLHIERLIIEGIDLQPAQKQLLQATLTSELSALLAIGGLAPQLSGGGSLARVNAPALQLPAKQDAAGFGRQIAASVYRSISQ